MNGSQRVAARNPTVGPAVPAAFGQAHWPPGLLPADFARAPSNDDRPVAHMAPAWRVRAGITCAERPTEPYLDSDVNQRGTPMPFCRCYGQITEGAVISARMIGQQSYLRPQYRSAAPGHHGI